MGNCCSCLSPPPEVRTIPPVDGYPNYYESPPPHYTIISSPQGPAAVYLPPSIYSQHSRSSSPHGNLEKVHHLEPQVPAYLPIMQQTWASTSYNYNPTQSYYHNEGSRYDYEIPSYELAGLTGGAPYTLPTRLPIHTDQFKHENKVDQNYMIDYKRPKPEVKVTPQGMQSPPITSYVAPMGLPPISVIEYKDSQSNSSHINSNQHKIPYQIPSQRSNEYDAIHALKETSLMQLDSFPNTITDQHQHQHQQYSKYGSYSRPYSPTRNDNNGSHSPRPTITAHKSDSHSLSYSVSTQEESIINHRSEIIVPQPTIPTNNVHLSSMAENWRSKALEDKPNPTETMSSSREEYYHTSNIIRRRSNPPLAAPSAPSTTPRNKVTVVPSTPDTNNTQVYPYSPTQFTLSPFTSTPHQSQSHSNVHSLSQHSSVMDNDSSTHYKYNPPPASHPTDHNHINDLRSPREDLPPLMNPHKLFEDHNNTIPLPPLETLSSRPSSSQGHTFTLSPSVNHTQPLDTLTPKVVVSPPSVPNSNRLADLLEKACLEVAGTSVPSPSWVTIPSSEHEPNIHRHDLDNHYQHRRSDPGKYVVVDDDIEIA
eukprot:NODE_1334_length_2006_cov_79.816251_g1128_i0.p1 GENE.NODE_1334_length_2006_cov_79.816251_g1128_i0~~NODE_1334_length_2006_cov_79.816251_g1128_i0.p1  ORF type:complete len:593 (-),score=123.71 NODE_1334_length_2006_cov_79.816251_g1128_i0:172-1950(-)